VAAAADDEEHVLGLAQRQLDLFAGLQLEAAQADGACPRGLREVRFGVDLVPVDDQSGSSPSQYSSVSIRPITPTPRHIIFFDRGYQQMSLGSRVPHARNVNPP